MKYDDDATGEPINTCVRCGKEEIGYVDDPEKEYICHVWERSVQNQENEVNGNAKGDVTFNFTVEMFLSNSSQDSYSHKLQKVNKK